MQSKTRQQYDQTSEKIEESRTGWTIKQHQKKSWNEVLYRGKERYTTTQQVNTGQRKWIEEKNRVALNAAIGMWCSGVSAFGR